jgi:peroxiredoxin
MSKKKKTSLKFNDPAPDAELRTAENVPVRLASLWEGKVLVLAFTRHFGCPQCKEMLDQFAQLEPELVKRGLSLAVITQGSPQETKAFCEERIPGVLCLSDPERKAYRAYGLSRGRMSQTVLSLRVMRSNRYLQKRKGWKPELPPPGQDALQMAGTFIIGPDGRIRLPYYYDDIADHAPVELLLEGIMGMGWDQSIEGPIAPEEKGNA